MKKRDSKSRKSPVTLKAVAKHVGLSPATVSQVLNDHPKSRSIPQQTKDRIFAAAHRLSYRPNPIARALRNASGDPRKTGYVLMFGGQENLQRAMLAVRQAGLRVPDDILLVPAGQLSPAEEQLA